MKGKMWEIGERGRLKSFVSESVVVVVKKEKKKKKKKAPD
jgi:hypothetical protein